MRKIIKNTPLLNTILSYLAKQRRIKKNRARIHLALKTTPIKVVLGASNHFDEQWIPTDAEYLNILDETDWKKCFHETKLDCLLAEHVWEHLTLEQGLVAAKNCFNYLKPKGNFRIAIPDGNHSDPAYIDQVKPFGTGNGAQDHKVLYNIHSLTQMLERAGFQVTPLEHFDQNKNFIATDWTNEKGTIRRSARYDNRNKSKPLSFTSLIVDAVKPA